MRKKLGAKSNSWLLAQRAKGSQLDAASHGFIEDEMNARNMFVPPLPKEPIPSGLSEKRTWVGVISLVGVMLAASFAKVSVQEFGLKAAIPFLLLGVGAWVFMRGNERTARDVSQERGLDKIGSGGFTELMYKAGCGDLDRVKDLLNYGENVNSIDRHGMTALMYAAANGQYFVVELLVERGAEVMLASRSGKTAADWAKAKDYSELANSLLLKQ